MLGKGTGNEEEIEKEQEEFGDILIEDFEDSYFNLTLKTLYILKHFKERPKFTHLMKSDDDTFVNVGKLENVLGEMTDTFPRGKFILGHQWKEVIPLCQFTKQDWIAIYDSTEAFHTTFTDFFLKIWQLSI